MVLTGLEIWFVGISAGSVAAARRRSSKTSFLLAKALVQTQLRNEQFNYLTFYRLQVRNACGLFTRTVFAMLIYR